MADDVHDGSIHLMRTGTLFHLTTEVHHQTLGTETVSTRWEKKKKVKISLQDVYMIMCFVSSSEPVEVRVLQEEFWSWPLTPVFWTWPAVTSDLNLVSPDYFEPLWNFWPHLKQLVAVRTHSLLMSDPPQRWYPNLCRLTCHGQLPGLALSPPTILVLSGGRPHTGRK